jgi:3-hydroxymyristoyl/3-hydroxydecanoyl-(acyl carrier protein) dehydratase
MTNPQELLDRYLSWSEDHIHQTGQLNRDLLELRRNGLRSLADLIEAQVTAFNGGAPARLPALFERERLVEFAQGSIVKALGPEYSIYDGRRSPRIPNGDLLLMSRVLAITGRRGEFNIPADVTAEYEVPTQSWYFAAGSDGSLPLSVLLEIALQPCGVLSAYIGTQLRLPEVDFFFRNLDGRVTLLRELDMRGKTIVTRARLLETIFSGTTIIQHFEFDLSTDGEVFFRGRSSFGFFPPEGMAAQAGLDGGKSVKPTAHSAEVEKPVRAPGKLSYLDGVQIDPRGGSQGAGYVFGLRRNNPADWYYACHFHQDPVMPGSLGIEAIVQAAESFAARKFGPNVKMHLAVGQEVVWKYRGQVLPTNKGMSVEIHFRPQDASAPELLIGDASLWCDDLRIYEVKGLALKAT